MKAPKYFTKKQSELLSLIYPAPVGEGLTIRNACVVLGIKESSAYARLKNFKERFPDAYEQLQTAIKINQRHRMQLKGGAEHGNSLTKVYEEYGTGFDVYIKEKF